MHEILYSFSSSDTQTSSVTNDTVKLKLFVLKQPMSVKIDQARTQCIMSRKLALNEANTFKEYIYIFVSSYHTWFFSSHNMFNMLECIEAWKYLSLRHQSQEYIFLLDMNKDTRFGLRSWWSETIQRRKPSPLSSSYVVHSFQRFLRTLNRIACPKISSTVKRVSDLSVLQHVEINLTPGNSKAIDIDTGVCVCVCVGHSNYSRGQ